MALRRSRVRISLGPLKTAARLFSFNGVLKRSVLAAARGLCTVRISPGPPEKRSEKPYTSQSLQDVRCRGCYY